MTDLIACLSTGKGTWGHVSRLISDQEWGRIYLIGDEFAKQKFTASKQFEFILIDPNKLLIDLTEQIKNALTGKLDFEVGLNLISGSGKEHMALLSALIKLGVGFRFVALTSEGIKEI